MCLFKKHFLGFNEHVWCPISTGPPPHCLSFSCTYLLLLGNLEKHQTLILLDVFLLDMLKIKQSSKHSNVVPYALNFSKNETFDKNINNGRSRIQYNFLKIHFRSFLLQKTLLIMSFF